MIAVARKISHTDAGLVRLFSLLDLITTLSEETVAGEKTPLGHCSRRAAAAHIQTQIAAPQSTNISASNHDRGSGCPFLDGGTVVRDPRGPAPGHPRVCVKSRQPVSTRPTRREMSDTLERIMGGKRNHS